jgi:hypothetical protein
VYALDSKDSVLTPYYNTNAVAPWSTNSKAVSSLGGSSYVAQFDAPIAGVRSANEQGLSVSPADGSINLANSLRQGLFGNDPRNGDTKEIPIYYRIGDGSRHSLLKSTVIVHYYNTLADVPGYLLIACQASQKAFAAQGTVFSTIETDATGTPVTPAKPAAVAAPVAPRPPQVVLVVKGH